MVAQKNMNTRAIKRTTTRRNTLPKTRKEQSGNLEPVPFDEDGALAEQMQVDQVPI